jgi:hypothetical protein
MAMEQMDVSHTRGGGQLGVFTRMGTQKKKKPSQIRSALSRGTTESVVDAGNRCRHCRRHSVSLAGSQMPPIPAAEASCIPVYLHSHTLSPSQWSLAQTCCHEPKVMQDVMGFGHEADMVLRWIWSLGDRLGG